MRKDSGIFEAAQRFTVYTSDLHQFNTYKFNLTFLKRFWRVLSIIFPQWKSLTVLLFIALLCLVLLEQYVIYQVGMIPSKYYKVLGEKDLSGFKFHTVIAVLIILAMALIRATKKYFCSVFYVATRGLLAKHLHSAYFSDIVYYQINILDAPTLDNPDQRISQDVERMCSSFSDIIADLLISPFTIGYYTYHTWISTGYIGPLCVFVFFVLSTVINKFIMSPVVSLVVKQEHMEGDFRFKHMQMRANCESAAFYRCGQLELLKTNKQLDRLLSTQQRLNCAQYLLNFFVNIADYMGSILSYIIMAIAIFGGLYDDLTPAELSSQISKNAFVTIYLISCFTRLIDMALQVSNIAGTTHRIVQLDETMTKLKSSSDDRDLLSIAVCNRDNIPLDTTAEVAYKVEKLSYGPPSSCGKNLVNDLSFQFERGVNLLVIGESGCGKSSLLRVLDGLWPLGKGSIARYVMHCQRGVLYLPQKPYLTQGTLREQIYFPFLLSEVNGMEDDQLLALINDVGLSDLYSRTGGLDCPLTWNWYDMLSPGEMQRVGFLRLFYHQPCFAVLDEATSQVSLDMETKLYSTCKKFNITVLSIGHRNSLRQFHQKELNILGNGEWRLHDLPHLNSDPPDYRRQSSHSDRENSESRL